MTCQWGVYGDALVYKYHRAFSAVLLSWFFSRRCSYKACAAVIFLCSCFFRRATIPVLGVALRDIFRCCIIHVSCCVGLCSEMVWQGSEWCDVGHGQPYETIFSHGAMSHVWSCLNLNSFWSSSSVPL